MEAFGLFFLAVFGLALLDYDIVRLPLLLQSASVFWPYPTAERRHIRVRIAIFLTALTLALGSNSALDLLDFRFSVASAGIVLRAAISATILNQEKRPGLFLASIAVITTATWSALAAHMISAVVLVMENISNTYQTLAITFRNQAFEIATISGTTNATDISRLVSESTEASIRTTAAISNLQAELFKVFCSYILGPLVALAALIWFTGGREIVREITQAHFRRA